MRKLIFATLIIAYIGHATVWDDIINPDLALTISNTFEASVPWAGYEIRTNAVLDLGSVMSRESINHNVFTLYDLIMRGKFSYTTNGLIPVKNFTRSSGGGGGGTDTNAVQRSGDTMTGSLTTPELIAGGISVTNLVVHGTDAWVFLVPIFFSNSIDFSSVDVSGIKFQSNVTSAVSFGMMTNWLAITVLPQYAVADSISGLTNYVNATSNNLWTAMIALGNTILTGSYGYTDARVAGTAAWFLNYALTNYIPLTATNFLVNSDGTINSGVVPGQLAISNGLSYYWDGSAWTLNPMP